MKHMTLHKQQGMTVLSWIIVLAFLLFIGITAIRIIPVYLTDMSIGNIFKNLGTDQTLRGQSRKKIKETVVKRLKINNVYDIRADDIDIKKAKGGYLVVLEYEPRGTLVGNLDYIVSFKHEATVPTR